MGKNSRHTSPHHTVHVAYNVGYFAGRVCRHLFDNRVGKENFNPAEKFFNLSPVVNLPGQYPDLSFVKALFFLRVRARYGHLFALTGNL
jgi:hypothetical protein